jgi:hypothetical protein
MWFEMGSRNVKVELLILPLIHIVMISILYWKYSFHWTKAEVDMFQGNEYP